MVPILERRYRLSIQAHAIPRLRLENLIEPRTSWKSIKVDLNAKGGGGGGGSGGGSILALLGGKSKDGKSKEKWIMSLPAAPPIYPLRAAIPFALSQLGTGKGSQPPVCICFPE